MDKTLQELRIKLDTIDSAILSLLADRFRVTANVGQVKRDYSLPPQDLGREAELFARIEHRAAEVGINPQLAHALWRQIIDEVIQNHTELQESAK